MFKDTIIKLLGNSYTNNSIKIVNGDFQDNNTTLEFEDYKYKCTKILFVDCIEPLLAESFYININNKIYRIIKSEQYQDHMEIYLFQCDLKGINVNGIDKKALILNIQDKINYEDDKIIIADFPIKTGDIVEYQNLKWFVISQIDTNINTLKARLRKVEQSFKIYVNNVLQEIPAIYEVATQTIMEGQQLNIVDGNIKALIQDNEITKKITYDNRFIKMGSPWKVQGFTTEHKGLRTLYLVKDLFNDFDDRINEIADRWSHENKTEYKIISDGVIDLQKGNSKKITTTVTNFGIVVDNPILYYNSLDSTIATVDDVGNITGIGVGSTTVAVKFIGLDNNEYIAIVVVNVADVKPVEVITYKIDNKNQLNDDYNVRRYVTKYYICKKYINDILTTGDYEVTCITNVTDLTKIAINNTVANEISINNKSSVDGTITISFKDRVTEVINTQLITLIR